jgi:hypothetical protein
MKNAMKYFAAATVIGLGVVSPLCSASMSGADSPPTKLVGYSDLNFDSETGAWSKGPSPWISALLGRDATPTLCPDRLLE